MAKDIAKTITNLKNIALSKCCDRIEEAAKKAREGEVKKTIDSHGVTSSMKRKHGL